MRTTLDLPDETFRKLKILAAARGSSLKQVLRSAVERELARASQRGVEQRVRFPVLKSKQPGTLRLTNADIEDLLA